MRRRSVELGARFLLEPTEYGDPSLVHGYAITGHVAQGLTTERTSVLAYSGSTRERLYVAMSRGRQTAQRAQARRRDLEQRIAARQARRREDDFGIDR